MRGNNISNRTAPTIAIKVEDFLLKFKEDTLKDKVCNKIWGKEIRAEFDSKVLKLVSFIFRHTDMTVDLIIDKSNARNMELIGRLDDLPFNRIIPIIKPVEIAILLNAGDLSYYVDDDENRRSNIGHKYCVNLSELNSFIR